MMKVQTWLYGGIGVVLFFIAGVSTPLWSTEGFALFAAGFVSLGIIGALTDD